MVVHPTALIVNPLPRRPITYFKITTYGFPRRNLLCRVRSWDQEPSSPMRHSKNPLLYSYITKQSKYLLSAPASLRRALQSNLLMKDAAGTNFVLSTILGLFPNLKFAE